jgi:hypothetical protein
MLRICICVILLPLSRFCRISEFGSINKREFVTRIVAQRQEVTYRNGTCTAQQWEFLRPFGSKRP